MNIPFTPQIVAPNDAGIRPAGPSDACIYCRRQVGERHRFECVMVEVSRTYRVLLDNVDVGTWSRMDPVHWSAEMRRFHKNDSSWCSHNIAHEGTLSVTDVAREVLCAEGDPSLCTLCSRVEFVPVDGEPEYTDAPQWGAS